MATRDEEAQTGEFIAHREQVSKECEKRRGRGGGRKKKGKRMKREMKWRGGGERSRRRRLKSKKIIGPKELL